MLTPGSVPAIRPPSPEAHRPRWSVMVPVYEGADLLAATLASVLEQDPGPDAMQIEVVDDHSTRDDPSSVVAEVAGDRVGFFRQPANRGIAGNLTTCVQRARGQLVHLLHGDDLVYPGFYRAAEEVLGAHPEVGAVFTGSGDVDQHGQHLITNEILRQEPGYLEDAYHQLFEWNPLRAPAIVARRHVYERVGGFRRGLRFCADWDMWKRLATATTVYYLPQVLTGYRVHSRSDTARLATSPQQLREMIDAVLVAHHYLPPGQTRAWTRKFYGRTRRWAWAQLRDGSTSDPATAARYAELAVESVVRQQLDRIRSAPRRCRA